MPDAGQRVTPEPEASQDENDQEGFVHVQRGEGNSSSNSERDSGASGGGDSDIEGDSDASGDGDSESGNDSDTMPTKREVAIAEIPSLIRKTRVSREDVTERLDGAEDDYIDATAEPPKPKTDQYILEQQERVTRLDLVRKVVKGNMDIVHQAVVSFKHLIVDRETGPNDAFNDDDDLRDFQAEVDGLEHEYITKGRKIEIFLDNLKMADKAAKDERARTNKMGDSEVPKFNGNKLAYHEFKRDFTKFVEKGERAPEQCLILLRRYLTGEAKTALEGVGSSDRDYDRAWVLLDRRYGDKDQLRQLLQFRIKQAKKLPAEGTAQTLRKHHDYMSGLYNKLRDAWDDLPNHEEVLYGDFLCTYPRATLEIAERNMPVDNKNLRIFFEQVEARILQMDRHTTMIEGAKGGKDAEKPKWGEKKKSGGTTHNFHNQDAKGAAGGAAKKGNNASNGNNGKKKSETGRGKLTKSQANKKGGSRGGGAQGGAASKPKQTQGAKGSDKKKSNSNPKCRLCSREHWLNDCKEFKEMSVNAREAKVKALDLCTKCFSGKHYSKDCKSNLTCSAKSGKGGGACGGRHHTLLHRKSQ